MAVIDVKRDWSGSTAESYVDGIRVIREAAEIFTVLFDGKGNPLLRSRLAENAPGIPIMWEAHPSDPWTYVSGKSVRPKDGPLLYEVTVNYSYEPDPLEQPPEISWTFSDSNEPIDRDIHGNPIVNSAGESFDPPITKPVHDLVLRYAHNEPFFNQEFADKYKGAVNQDWFLGFAPGKVKCTIFDGVQTRVAHLIFWRVTREFCIRRTKQEGLPDVGWKRRILDQGCRVKDDSGQTSPSKEDDGSRTSQPVLLDGTGKKLASGATPVFLEFQLDELLPFSQLGIA